MSGDIRAFLTARWDEQQLRAQQGLDEAPPRTIHLSSGGTEEVREGVDYWRYVLDDVAAKRAILALHAEPHECPEWDKLIGGDPVTGYFGGDEPCPTVRLLAAPFASHPDFDPAWRIEP